MNNEIRHYGVIGMRWGIRKYQNADGTLTEAGKKRYDDDGEYRYTSASTKRANARAERTAMKVENRASTMRSDKLARLKEKAAIQAEKARRSQELDDRMLQYAKSTTSGKNFLLKNTIGVGAKSYVTVLAALNGQGQKGITAKKVASLLASNGGGVLASFLARAMYKRGDFDQFNK